jgi:hypothetical protein
MTNLIIDINDDFLCCVMQRIQEVVVNVWEEGK